MIAREPWQVIPITGFPTVGELAAAAGTGVATVGFALGSGTLPGMTGLAGVHAVCLPWGAAAVAAARLLRSDDGRWMGVLARGAINGLPRPGAGGSPEKVNSRTINLAAGPNFGPSFSGSFTNPFPTMARMTVVGTVNGELRLSPGSPLSALGPSVNFSSMVQGAQTIGWQLLRPGGGGALPSGTVTVTFVVAAVPGETTSPALTNAERAIPLLDATAVAIYGNTVPWWPTGEILARGGNWMRRRSWADAERRIRFEPGPGTAPEVAVLRDESNAVPIPLRSQDFGTAEFLAQDWESYFIPDPNALIDVTDFRFSAELGGGAGFYFAVGGDSEPDSGSGTGGEDRPPGTGDFVRAARNGVAQWIPLEEYQCPEE